MKTISINNFSGGIDDPRSTVNGACTSSRHFMLGRTKLTPYRDMETESLNTGSIASNKPTDVVKGIILNGATPLTVNLYALGEVGANTNPKFYAKATSAVTSNFDAMSNGEGSGLGAVTPGSLIIYKGNLYCLVNDGTNSKLIKHIYGTSTLSVGTIGSSPTFTVAVSSQPFIHPKDNKLYMFSGYTMGVWDGSTLSTRAFGEDYNIISACPYGNNIMIGMVAKDNTHSVAGIWDGSLTSSVLVDVVRWGNDALVVLENIGDTVIGISTISVGGSDDLGTQNAVIIRGYAGGSPQLIKKIESVGGSAVYACKAKRNDVLYFPLFAYLNGTRVQQIYSIYKNEQGTWVVAPDRKINNNTEVTDTIRGLSSVGDYIWVAFTGAFMRTNNDENFTATSQYITLVNPNMETSDRSKKKQLKAVSLRCGSPTSASHTVTLSVSADGGAYETIYSGASSSKVRVIEEVKLANGKSFLDAREYMFKIETTGNGEVYELKYGYEIIPSLI